MLTKCSLLKTTAIACSIALITLSAQAKSCLWKATSDKGTLYVQGSVHLLKATDYPLAPAIEEAYAKSDVLVLEADMKAMLSTETQQLIMAKAMLPGGQTLEGSLSPEVYKLLSEKLTEADLPIMVVQQFKPWFTAMTLMLTKMQAMGFDPNLGLDQYFYNKATTDKKTVIGLETVKFQIDLFDSLAEGNQDAYMKRALKELNLFETMLNELMQSWKQGDIDGLGKIMLESFNEYPGLYDRFVVDRNKTWIKKIDDLASKHKTHMVVVGAAHLPREEGLLKLLEKKGFTLEQQ
ncbi:MAG: TraB/GumN family protein [Pontiella sp.]